MSAPPFGKGGGANDKCHRLVLLGGDDGNVPVDLSVSSLSCGSELIQYVSIAIALQLDSTFGIIDPTPLKFDRLNV